jgi:hypothetical protein
MELREHPLSEGFLKCFKFYLPESAENTIFPISVSKKSVKVRMIVECLAGCLYGEDSGEFTLVNAECLRQCSPRGTEEDCIEFSVVLKEDSQAFGDGEDGVAMGYVLDHFVVDMLGELHCPLSSAGWAHPTALAGEGDKEGVFTPITVYSSSPVSEDPAVEIFIEGLQHLVP